MLSARGSRSQLYAAKAAAVRHDSNSGMGVKPELSASERASLMAFERRRIALFQAYWKLHSSTVFSAIVLAREGYEVDVYLYEVDEIGSSSVLDETDGVNVYRFESSERSNQKIGGTEVASLAVYRGYRAKAARILRRLQTLIGFYTGSEKGLFPKQVLKQSANLVRQRMYRAVIATEKGGLVWAGALSRMVPGQLIIYSSLELYTREHWYCSRGYLSRRLKNAEEKYHQRCWATIVQDRQRSQILLADNRVTGDARLFHVPISRLGQVIPTRSDYLQRQLGLTDKQVLILSHGLISPTRFCLQLAALAQEFRSDWVLVFHGYGERKHLDQIREMNRRSNVYLSLELIDLSREAEIVGSATIGLVLYGNEYLNDMLTGFSSEKLALYLQCGVPIIAFDYPSYGHIREEGCGVLIRSLHELPTAVDAIMNSYSEYRRRAFDAFERHYRFDLNFAPVLAALEAL